MNKGQKNTVVRIAASALLLGTAWLPLLSPALHIALCAAAYLVIGADILFRAVRNILHGKIFDENFLMSVATSAHLPSANTRKRSRSCCSIRPESYFRIWP